MNLGKMPSCTRRDLLKNGVLTSAAALLSGCIPDPEPTLTFEQFDAIASSLTPGGDSRRVLFEARICESGELEVVANGLYGKKSWAKRQTLSGAGSDCSVDVLVPQLHYVTGDIEIDVPDGYLSNLRQLAQDLCDDSSQPIFLISGWIQKLDSNDLILHAERVDPIFKG